MRASWPGGPTLEMQRRRRRPPGHGWRGTTKRGWECPLRYRVPMPHHLWSGASGCAVAAGCMRRLMPRVHHVSLRRMPSEPRGSNRTNATLETACPSCLVLANVIEPCRSGRMNAMPVAACPSCLALASAIEPRGSDKANATPCSTTIQVRRTGHHRGARYHPTWRCAAGEVSSGRRGALAPLHAPMSAPGRSYCRPLAAAPAFRTSFFGLRVSPGLPSR